jgi:hypothetical protein
VIDTLARPLFRVGDVVTIEPDIVDDAYEMFNGWGDVCWFVEPMYHYRGRTMRLSAVDTDCYRINCPGIWGWVDGMFVESNRVTKFLRN